MPSIVVNTIVLISIGASYAELIFVHRRLIKGFADDYTAKVCLTYRQLKALGRVRVIRRISGVKELTFVLAFVVTKAELESAAGTPQLMSLEGPRRGVGEMRMHAPSAAMTTGKIFLAAYGRASAVPRSRSYARSHMSRHRYPSPAGLHA